jgi:mono/diheme cytochrome c family protein
MRVSTGHAAKPMKCVALVALAFTLLAPASQAQDPGRGHLLYYQQCLRCHAPDIHRPERRKVRTYEGLRAAVIQWQREAAANWTTQDIRDVVTFLNETHYHFECPQRLCELQAESE